MLAVGLMRHAICPQTRALQTRAGDECCGMARAARADSSSSANSSAVLQRPSYWRVPLRRTGTPRPTSRKVLELSSASRPFRRYAMARSFSTTGTREMGPHVVFTIPPRTSPRRRRFPVTGPEPIVVVCRKVSSPKSGFRRDLIKREIVGFAAALGKRIDAELIAETLPSSKPREAYVRSQGLKLLAPVKPTRMAPAPASRQSRSRVDRAASGVLFSTPDAPLRGGAPPRLACRQREGASRQ